MSRARLNTQIENYLRGDVNVENPSKRRCLFERWRCRAEKIENEIESVKMNLFSRNRTIKRLEGECKQAERVIARGFKVSQKDIVAAENKTKRARLKLRAARRRIKVLENIAKRRNTEIDRLKAIMDGGIDVKDRAKDRVLEHARRFINAENPEEANQAFYYLTEEFNRFDMEYSHGNAPGLNDESWLEVRDEIRTGTFVFDSEVVG